MTPTAEPARYYRKVIQIKAEDSPNVKYGLIQRAKGITPTGDVLIPGVLPWRDYVKRRSTWDKVLQCIGLDAEFWEGADTLLYPPDWLNRAEAIARLLEGRPRKARAIGIDPAEGGDKTAMAAVDEWGLIELVSKKTPDTSIITGEALAFMRKHGVDATNVGFDRGGGGKEHADRLRAQGYHVRTVAFGESIVMEPKRGLRTFVERKDSYEERYAYKNRRAEMYGSLRSLLDPGRELDPTLEKNDPRGFGLPARYNELRRQLAPIPLLYDGEGRMVMPPKNKKDANDERVTLSDIIGCSPDEADALVLAIHCMLYKAPKQKAGAASR